MAFRDILGGFHPEAVLSSGTDASDEPILAMDEIQGQIVPGFGTGYLVLLGLARDEAAGSSGDRRRWLRQLAPLVATARQVYELREVRRSLARATGRRPDQPDVLLAVAWAFPLLDDLGLSTAGIHDSLFRAGMRATVHMLQDPVDDAGAPIGWRLGATPADTPDLLLLVGCDDRQRLAAAEQALRESLTGSGFRVVYAELGSSLSGTREHFGFRDDISQPAVRGRVSARPDQVLTRRYLAPGDPRHGAYARPGQPLVWPGQFLFGYPQQTEGATTPGTPAIPPEPWMAHGSYLVFRRLRQDVAAFRRFAERQALVIAAQTGRPVSPDEVQAWIVGRWPDGTPLARFPAGHDPATADDDQAVNFFSYQAEESAALVSEHGVQRTIAGCPADLLGGACPRFAHVRKVNLRGATDLGESTRFLILRRGMPYGPEYVENEAPPIDRGLLFLAYMQSVQGQFQTLSRTWMNSAAAPEGEGHDLLVGQDRSGRTARREYAGQTVVLESPPNEQWVVPTGGGYYFAPATSVLATLPE